MPLLKRPKFQLTSDGRRLPLRGLFCGGIPIDGNLVLNQQSITIFRLKPGNNTNSFVGGSRG
ncbi:MAG: hypothetical protein ABR903_08305 [Thermodesulfovibrionales bacterium]